MHSSEVEKYFGAQKLGEHFYLFKAPRPSQRLIITAHGIQPPLPDHCRVPEGSALRYFCHHGEILEDPHLIFAARNNVRPKEVIQSGQPTFRYLLSRFRRDNYMNAAMNARDFGVDILTVRNRRGWRVAQRDALSTRHVFEALAKAGLHYATIDAQHCRGSYGDWLADSTPLGLPDYEIDNPHLASLMQKLHQPTYPYGQK